jgi:hypothetical protein
MDPPSPSRQAPWRRFGRQHRTIIAPPKLSCGPIQRDCSDNTSARTTGASGGGRCHTAPRVVFTRYPTPPRTLMGGRRPCRRRCPCSPTTHTPRPRRPMALGSSLPITATIFTLLGLQWCCAAWRSATGWSSITYHRCPGPCADDHPGFLDRGVPTTDALADGMAPRRRRC